MALTSGTKLGPYEIQSPLGAGGMGELYRGRDSRLGRDVALKVLPVAFAADTERMARIAIEEALRSAAGFAPNRCRAGSFAPLASRPAMDTRRRLRRHRINYHCRIPRSS
ncbi:MAG: hypothetical protein ABSG40_10815 [Terriglobales bacterium]|jgi:serine/threonine protein kinase